MSSEAALITNPHTRYDPVAIPPKSRMGNAHFGPWNWYRALYVTCCRWNYFAFMPSIGRPRSSDWFSVCMRKRVLNVISQRKQSAPSRKRVLSSSSRDRNIFAVKWWWSRFTASFGTKVHKCIVHLGYYRNARHVRSIQNGQLKWKVQFACIRVESWNYLSATVSNGAPFCVWDICVFHIVGESCNARHCCFVDRFVCLCVFRSSSSGRKLDIKM